jgi:DNA-binding transcriptional LysR family regulator
MEDTLAKKKKRFNQNGYSVNSNEAVKQAVIAGIGISIMPVIGFKTN